MNVRFFAGTRQQYDSLPSPRNPLGLYFCEDTKELFWSDRLLTDGMRVVPTYADLPEPTKAADGVVYYVTETRNGYVVPHGTNKWLQTIYAPVLDVTKVPESEIYNTVTTVGAVRDIEAKIYKTIDERIANIEIGSSGNGVKAIYFAGRQLDAHDDGTYHIDRLCALRALGFSIPEDQEGEDFELVTKEYVDSQIKAIANIDLTKYYTKDEVNELIPDTSNFVTKAELPSVPKKISELENDAGYLTEHQDLSEYAKKSDIPSVSGFATKAELQEAIESIEHPKVNLDGYATEAWVTEQGFLKEHQDLSSYATKEMVTDVQDAVNNLEAITSKQKYEVLPFDGAIINYADNEVRVNTQHVDINSLPIQNAGDDSSDKYYYMTFRAYAPDGATSVIEGQSDKMDAEHSALAIDKYGRKYTTIWAAIANKSGDSWSKFGDISTVDKYLGFYYNFHWYNGDALIGMDKVRVILTNDACHNELVPDAVARRIDDKIASLSTSITNVTEQITNLSDTIENNYVQNDTLENYVTNEYIQQQNYITNQYIEQNYTTSEQLAATYVTNNELTEKVELTVTEVIQEKVEAGDIAVKAESIGYDTF